MITSSSVLRQVAQLPLGFTVSVTGDTGVELEWSHWSGVVAMVASRWAHSVNYTRSAGTRGTLSSARQPRPPPLAPPDLAPARSGALPSWLRPPSTLALRSRSPSFPLSLSLSFSASQSHTRSRNWRLFSSAAPETDTSPLSLSPSPLDIALSKCRQMRLCPAVARPNQSTNDPSLACPHVWSWRLTQPRQAYISTQHSSYPV